ncbi:hypothetical protein [Streptomyces sp. Ac-502]|uniref:hypothetical protein n=1 Tax=Streptomyces sp. Ac-502 TaxID=3342801 RepID=UPI0038622179
MTHSQGSHHLAHGGHGPSTEPPRDAAVENPDPYGRYAAYGDHTAYGAQGGHRAQGEYGAYSAYSEYGPYDVYETYSPYGTADRYERHDPARDGRAGSGPAPAPPYPYPARDTDDARQPQDTPGGPASPPGTGETWETPEAAASPAPGRVPHQGPLVPLRDDLAGVPAPAPAAGPPPAAPPAAPPTAAA